MINTWRTKKSTKLVSIIATLALVIGLFPMHAIANDIVDGDTPDEPIVAEIVQADETGDIEAAPAEAEPAAEPADGVAVLTEIGDAELTAEMYPISINVSPTDSGICFPSQEAAAEGDLVILQCRPNQGYRFSSINAETANGIPVTWLEIGSESSSFFMPNDSVNVSVTFEEISVPTLTLTYADTVDESANVLTMIDSVTVNGTTWDHSTTTASGQIQAGTSVTIRVTPTTNATVTNSYAESGGISDFSKTFRTDGIGIMTFTMPENDATVSVYFGEAVLLTYDANGGTPGSEWPTNNTGKMLRKYAGASITITLPQTMDPAFVAPPDGKEFAGEEITYDNGTVSVEPGKSGSDLSFVNGGNFKMLWRDATEYTVKFWYYDGPNSKKLYDTQTVSGTHMPVAKPSSSPTVQGWTATGEWRRNADSSDSKWDFSQPVSTGCSGTSTTLDLYAEYSPWTTNVATYDSTNGTTGGGKVYTFSSVLIGNPVEVSESTWDNGTLYSLGAYQEYYAEADEGYEFVKWIRVPSGGDPASSDNETVSEDTQGDYEHIAHYVATANGETVYAVFQEAGPMLTVNLEGFAASDGIVSVPTVLDSITVNGTELSIEQDPEMSSRYLASKHIQAGSSVTVTVTPTDDGMVMGVSDPTPSITDWANLYTLSGDGSFTVTFTMPTEDTAFTLTMSDAVVITYDINGGTPTDDWPGDVVKLPASVAPNVGFNLNVSTYGTYAEPPTGKEFAGIQVNCDKGLVTGTPGQTLSDVTFSDDGSITWLWSTASYEVTFDLQGGTAAEGYPIAAQTVEYEGHATNPTPSEESYPTKTNLVFSGWYKDAACTEAFDFATEEITDATIIYAGWAVTVSAIAQPNNEGVDITGCGVTVNSDIYGAIFLTSVLEGHDVTLKAQAADGFRFVGWIAASDFTQPVDESKLISTATEYTMTASADMPTAIMGVFVETATITFNNGGGTQGTAWVSSTSVDVGSNLSEVLGSTVPTSVDANIVTPPEGQVFAGYKITIDAGISKFENGAPIDLTIGAEGATVEYMWRGPAVTIHWSSIDGVDLETPIVFKAASIGSTVSEALLAYDKLLGDSFFSRDGYIDSHYRVPQPMTEYEYMGIAGLYIYELYGSETIEGDMDIYVVMFREINPVEITFDSAPVAGTSTETTKTEGYWDWNTQTNPPSVSVSSDANYALDTYDEDEPEAFWIEEVGSGDPFVGTFEAGEQYLAEFWLRADYGYAFSGNTETIINGGEFVESDYIDQSILGVYAKVTAEPTAEYSVVSGDGGTYVLGSNEDLEFVFKRNVHDDKTIELFTGILVDGEPVDFGNYTVVAGSADITLKAAYLETLSEGDHTLTARFEDGDADANFTVQAKASDESGKSDSSSSNSGKTSATGDATPLGAMVLLALLSGAALVATRRMRTA